MATQQQTLIKTSVEKDQLVARAGAQLVKTEGNGDQIYKAGDIYMRCTTLAGGKVRIILTKGSCSC